MIVGTFLGSITTFFQVLIDPNEFLGLQSKMFASFNNVNSDLVWLAGVIILITFIYGARHMNQLDVMSLGRDTAINLGVPYDSGTTYVNLSFNFDCCFNSACWSDHVLWFNRCKFIISVFQNIQAFHLNYWLLCNECCSFSRWTVDG